MKVTLTNGWERWRCPKCLQLYDTKPAAEHKGKTGPDAHNCVARPKGRWKHAAA